MGLRLRWPELSPIMSASRRTWSANCSGGSAERIVCPWFPVKSPDATVVCGKPEYIVRQGIGCLVNPTVVIEVSSPGTAARDEVDKLLAYTAIRTIREYLVVSSERCVVKMFFRRQAEETWSVRLYTQPTDSVGLESCGCQLTLAEIYAGVEFPERDDFPVGLARGRAMGFAKGRFCIGVAADLCAWSCM